MRVLALMAMLLTLPTHLPAATLETDITPEMAEMGCTVRLSGQIVAGDAERLRPYLETDLGLTGVVYPGAEDDITWRNFSPAVTFGFPGMFVHRLCLNSPGGSLTEAMRIADLIRSTPFGDGSIGGGIPTAVARGDSCESTCALLFFAGRFVFSEGDANYEDDADNILHPMGRLGLHAPFLPFTEATYSNDQIRDIWRVGMDSVALISRRITDGTLQISRDLFSELLTYPADQMLYIETVGQAVRWNIDLAPNTLYFGIYRQSEDDLFDALCRNAVALAPVYLDMQFDGTRVRRLPSGGVEATSDTLFTDRKTGTRYACRIDASALSLPAERSRYIPQRDPLQSGRTAIFSAPNLPLCSFAVRFSGQCPTECAFDVELPCFAAFAPETRLADIDAGPPR